MAEKKEKVTKEILTKENILLERELNAAMNEDERVRKEFSILLAQPLYRAPYTREFVERGLGRSYNDREERNTAAPEQKVYSWEAIAFLIGQVVARSGYKEMLERQAKDAQTIGELTERLQHFEEEDRRRRER